jgi:hypothetical protein
MHNEKLYNFFTDLAKKIRELEVEPMKKAALTFG